MSSPVFCDDIDRGRMLIIRKSFHHDNGHLFAATTDNAKPLIMALQPNR
ncbi:MAG: hypothetical protein R3C01_15550 [Planctomycetaceae bacterium]